VHLLSTDCINYALTCVCRLRFDGVLNRSQWRNAANILRNSERSICSKFSALHQYLFKTRSEWNLQRNEHILLTEVKLFLYSFLMEHCVWVLMCEVLMCMNEVWITKFVIILNFYKQLPLEMLYSFLFSRRVWCNSLQFFCRTFNAVQLENCTSLSIA